MMTNLHAKHFLIACAIAELFAAAPLALAQSASPSPSPSPSSSPAASTATVLPEVQVSSSREESSRAVSASVGGFAQAPLLETPASVFVTTSAQMQDQQVHQTSEALKRETSVNDAYNAIGYAEQFSVRGFALDTSSSYRKDGLPIPGDAQIPLENKERIELLKGLSGLQAGESAPGGILNFVTKRPTATPLRTVTVQGSERGTLYGAVDLGGRFSDERFGYRINAATEDLHSYVKGANGERQFVSGAFDWQLTPQALLQLDFDYQRKSQVSVPGFQLFNGTDLPTGIAANTNLNNQPWTKPVTTRDSDIGARFEYAFNADWRGSIAANRHSFKRDDYAAFPYGCGSANLYPGFCGNGDYDVYDYQSTNESKTPLALQAQLQGKFSTAGIGHILTIGAAGMRRRDELGDCVYGLVDCAGSLANGTSNVYAPVVVDPSTISTGAVVVRRSERERSLFVQDIVALSERLSLHAGLRHTELEREQFDVSGAQNARYDRSYLLPNLALVVKPMQNLALYGSYAQGLEHGGIAPFGTTNANAVLDPSKSRQLEVGLKADLARDFSVTAALFQITRPLEITNADFDYVRSGDAVHRGVELSAQGRLTRLTTLGTGVTALNARARDTGSSLDGKLVTNVPRWKAVAWIDQAVPQVPGTNLLATWHYSSSKAFNPDNTVTVPGYHTVDLAARYQTRIAGRATTLRAGVDNVFNKFYWRDVTQSLGGYLFPGAPRTFTVSAQFDF
ncbi:MAG: TonB-dependent siderophore receptor [Janthinobacterium lividum]